MRTPKEIVEYLKYKIKQLGLGQEETLKKAGLSTTIFAMSLKRNLYMRLESIIAISNVLNISVGEILGYSDNEIPEDIQQMISMLLTLPKDDRRMIAMNIENYFSIRNGKIH